MSTSIQLYDAPRSIAAIGDQRKALRELMQSHMKDEVHYGIIHGTPKPTLYKPGSELILSMLNIAVEPVVEDLSTPDEMRYRVTCRLLTMSDGRLLGAGIGEASSAESKYQWRGVICDQEWDATPTARRREVWKKGAKGNAPYMLRQVRTEMNDVANTILKMAKKRAQIDATLTTTAASDLFMQDAQEVIDAGLDIEEASSSAQQQTQQRPAEASGYKKQAAPAQAQQSSRPAQSQPSNERLASESQCRRFYAIWKGSGKHQDDVDAYLASMGIRNDKEIPARLYEEVCEWAAS